MTHQRSTAVTPARDDSGMTTAEYAVGAVGACTIAGVLVHIGGSDWFNDLLREFFISALEPRTLFEVLGLRGVPSIGLWR